MMNLKVIVSLFFILSIIHSPLINAEEDHDKAKQADDASRAKSDEKKLPKQYSELEEVLKTKSDETKVEVVGFDSIAGKENILKWGITDVKDKETVSSRKDLITALDKIKVYREKLNTGKWCDSDKSAKDFAGILDSYIQYLSTQFIDGKGKTTKLSEKVINTYTMGLRHFMEDKATSFEAKKVKFEKSDKDLTLALNDIATVLWKGSLREEKFNKDFPWTVLKDDKEVKDVVAIVQKSREDLKAMATAEATKSGEKLCKLDADPTGPVGSVGTTAGATAGTSAGTTVGTTAGATAGTTAGTTASTTAGTTAGTTSGNPAPPQDPTTSGTTAGTTVGTTAGGDPTPQLPQNPTPQTPAVQNPFGQQDPVQAQAIRDLLDDAARRRLEDEQNDLQDDDLLKQALAQLGQIQPPSNRTNSPSREESNQGPQISPSIETGGKGQQQPQPPPQFPVPPSQGLGGLPPGLFQTPQVPLIPMPEPKRWDNDSPRPAPLPVEDARTTALMEMLKVQQQMLQGAIQQGSLGMTQNMGNGMNINRLNGGMFGRGRTTMSSGRRSLPGRSGGKVFRGTAKGGALGRMSKSPNSRGRLPSGIR